MVDEQEEREYKILPFLFNAFSMIQETVAIIILFNDEYVRAMN